MALLLAVLVLAALLAPGLDGVREELSGADPRWIALAVALEALSCASYVVMFRPVFCPRMPWRTTWQIGLAEQGAGAIIPASGAGGLALGAWILRESGMPVRLIAQRSVAFFLIKSSVNFVAVAALGFLAAAGLAGTELSLWLTAVPAALSLLLIAAVVAIGRLGPGAPPGPDASRPGRAAVAVRRALVGGIREAVTLVRSRNPHLLAGAFGYWAFDNAVLWATYQAFAEPPALAVVVMGYLIGQLGGLLPLPGGLGGIDGGLIGMLIAYGAPPAATAAAVLGYRLILFWLPLLIGSIAFASLRRGLNRPDRPDLCVVPQPAS